MVSGQGIELASWKQHAIERGKQAQLWGMPGIVPDGHLSWWSFGLC